MLGNKKILQAAWIASAPHHGWGRSIKVGKEEIMGMLAAVEMWVKRDHDAEWKTWLSWLDKIGNKAKTVDTVTTSVSEARGLSNRTPRLDIRWDAAKIGMTGSQVMQHLLATEPRINLAGGGANNVSIVPYMMMPDEVDIVANRIHAVLSKPPQLPAAEAPPQGEPVSVAGQWNLDLICHYSTAKHKIMLEQNGATLMGTHQGEFASGDLNGTVAANTVRFQSAYQGPGSRISYRFTGTVDGGKMSGTVDLGEYGVAQWTAERHQYRTGGRGRRG
jgi:L-seryl-tRNA(Ser) seleniumtransferase